MKLEKIGIIRTPFKKDNEIPFQVHKSNEIGKIIINEEYEKALKDIEGFSHIYVIYYLHKKIEKSKKENHQLKSNGNGLTVKPYLDNRIHGTFATRSPNRPNPIGISILELIERNNNVLKVKNVDMFDKTPVIDIKPYISKFDKVVNSKSGWVENSSEG